MSDKYNENNDFGQHVDPKSIFGPSSFGKQSPQGQPPRSESYSRQHGVSNSDGGAQLPKTVSDLSSYYEGRREKVKNFTVNFGANSEYADIPDFTPAQKPTRPKREEEVFSYSKGSDSSKHDDYLELTRTMEDVKKGEREKAANRPTARKRPPDAKRADGQPAQKRRPAAVPKGTAQKTAPKKRVKKKAPKPKYSFTSMLLGFACCLVFIVGLTATASTVALSTINDILAISESTEVVQVSIPEGANFAQIMDILSEKGLVRQKLLCTIFGKFRHFDEYTKRDGTVVQVEYIPGNYYLEKDMGFEAMLNSMKAARTSSAQTVRLSFPEGWSIQQIIDKLDKNEVCDAEKLYANLDIAASQYDFYASIPVNSSRYMNLEGYMFPDTYEFYIGENANSVIKKFFNNFNNKWTDEFEQRRVSLGLTMDEVITIASIIQREAKDKTQMAAISSVIHNRLKNSATYPQLQCDSTLNYANNYIIPNVDSYNGQLYSNAYNTYSIKGLTPGAICNPGADAINAALNPSSTSYFFFCHDKEGNLYLAKTYDEQRANITKIFS